MAAYMWYKKLTPVDIIRGLQHMPFGKMQTY